MPLLFSTISPSSAFSKAYNRINKVIVWEDYLIVGEAAGLGEVGSVQASSGRQEEGSLGIEQRSSIGFRNKLIPKLALYNKQHYQMALRKQSHKTKRKYAKISQKKREMLVELVIRQDFGLAKTARKLNIKLSTAKLILRKYKQTGKFHIRRTRRERTDIPLQTHPVKQQDLLSSLFQVEEHSASCSKEEQPITTPNFYPMVCADMSLPYLSFYGVGLSLIIINLYDYSYNISYIPHYLQQCQAPQLQPSSFLPTTFDSIMPVQHCLFVIRHSLLTHPGFFAAYLRHLQTKDALFFDIEGDITGKTNGQSQQISDCNFQNGFIYQSKYNTAINALKHHQDNYKKQLKTAYPTIRVVNYLKASFGKLMQAFIFLKADNIIFFARFGQSLVENHHA